MTTIRGEGDLKPIGPFPRGVTNTTTDVPAGALRDAVNVDLSDEGRPRRRRGYTRVLAGDDVHSLFGHADIPFLLARAGENLLALTGNGLTPVLLAEGLGRAPASYAFLNGRVCWSVAGVATGAIGSDLELYPLGVPTADVPKIELAQNGGLHEGRYQVAITYFNELGEEGGAALAKVIDVPANGGITVTLPDPPEGVHSIGLYRTDANGSALWFAGEVLAGVLEYTLMQGVQPGRGLETQHLHPLPPGHLLRVLNGIGWVAWENQLYHGIALRPWLHHPGHHRIPFRHRIDMLEPVGNGDAAGLFVAAGDRTFYLGGGLGEKMGQTLVYPHGAVPGTSIVVPGSVFGSQYTGHVAYWMATNGTPMLGLPGGTVTPLTEDTVSMHKFERGASLLRETNGLRQVITAGRGGTMGAFAATDSAEVFQYRNGIPVP